MYDVSFLSASPFLSTVLVRKQELRVHMLNVYNPEMHKGKANCITHPRYLEVWFYRKRPSSFGISEQLRVILKMENLGNVHRHQLIWFTELYAARILWCFSSELFITVPIIGISNMIWLQTKKHASTFAHLLCLLISFNSCSPPLQVTLSPVSLALDFFRLIELLVLP